MVGGEGYRLHLGLTGFQGGGRSRGIVRLKFLAVVGFVWTRLVLGWWGSWGS